MAAPDDVIVPSLFQVPEKLRMLAVSSIAPSALFVQVPERVMVPLVLSTSTVVGPVAGDRQSAWMSFPCCRSCPDYRGSPCRW